MGSRWILAAVALAIAGVGAWILVRGGHDPDEPRAPLPVEQRVAPPASVAAPRAPTLEHLADPLAADAVAAPAAVPADDDAFTGEARDSQWASVIEADLTSRFRAIAGGATLTPDCRQSRCRVTIVGSDLVAVSQAIAGLESKRGLQGYATELRETAPQHRADGSYALEVFATFDRDASGAP